MQEGFRNLVFEGGGVLGIAFLGALEYLYEINAINGIIRVAGSSAGAITACLTSFRLPFHEMKAIVDTLDYQKIPGTENNSHLRTVSEHMKMAFLHLFGDMECVYRLLNRYGYFSTQYFYEWIQSVIAKQFDQSLKEAPYTFADFQNPKIHVNNMPFMDLYLTGTDISSRTLRIFSHETSPQMEVAQAVRISMSIPIYFEAVQIQENSSSANFFSDGGIINNYPLHLFDSEMYHKRAMMGANMSTLGMKFNHTKKDAPIHNLLDFIENLVHSFLQIQREMYQNNPIDVARSIEIDTQGVSPIDFKITTDSENYHLLYQQGYKSAKMFFEAKNSVEQFL